MTTPYITTDAYLFSVAGDVLNERHMDKPEPDYLCMPQDEWRHALKNGHAAMVAERDRGAVLAWWVARGGTVAV